MRIGIVGAGKLGQALGGMLREHEITCSFWDAYPAKVPGQGSLADACAGVDMLFLCVPSWTVRAAVVSVLPVLSDDCPLISFAKGIEKDSLKTMAELLPDLAPGRPYAVVGGPMLADEIAAGKAAVGVIGSLDEGLANDLARVFSSSRFRTEVSADPFSVSLAGVLKNVYAVSLGIADGLSLSGNEKGWLVCRAIEEMAAAAAALGADVQIVLGAAGVGDLIATGFSPFSRNRQVGDEIVRTGACKLPGEGLMSLPQLEKRLQDTSAYPLLRIVRTAGIDCEPAAPAFGAFFNEGTF